MKRLAASVSVVALLVAGGLFLLTQATIGGNAEDPHKAAVVSVDSARANLQKLLPAKSNTISFDGTSDRPGVRTYAFSGPDFTALVDVSDGHVAMLGLSIPDQAGSASVTSDGALRIATDYLKSVGSPYEGMDVTITPTTGSGTPGFSVNFQRMLGDIAVPDYRMVEVDAGTGTVFSLVDVRRPFDDPGCR